MIDPDFFLLSQIGIKHLSRLIHYMLYQWETLFVDCEQIVSLI